MTNQMNVTDLGILNINRKIIDSRQYNGSAITNVGNVNVIDGTASSFNSSNYLYTDSLSLYGDTMSIIFSGTFLPLEETQCAWKLTGSDTPNTVSLLFIDHSVQLKINSEVIIEFTDVPLADVSTIKMITNISSNACEFILDVENEVFQKSIELGASLDFENFDTVYLGNNPANLENFWRGTINLQNFEILQDEVLVYSPSTNYPLSFSKIAVSDGQYPLDNNTIDIAKHVYLFDIDEVTRTNNTLLLTSVLDETASLTIREIGLYAETAEGKILFSKLDNLNINKGEGVPYDLIFTINLTVNFLNVVGFPEENSIVLNKSNPAKLKDFLTVKELLLYIVASLEKIITKNATDIGYNQAQVLYRLQQQIEAEEDTYYSIQTYSSLVEKFKEIIETQFDQDSVNTYGDVNIGVLGEANNFSTSNYATARVNIDTSKDWELNTAFSLAHNFGEDKQSIATLTKQNTPTLALEATYEDTMTWSEPSRSPDFADHPWKITVSDGSKVYAYSSDGYVSTSTDGEEWTMPSKTNLNSKFLGGFFSYCSMTYGNGKFVIVKNDGYISTSTDGVTWNNFSQNTNLKNKPYWVAVTHGVGKFVALGQYTTGSTSGYLATSTDGTTWTVTQNSNLKITGNSPGNWKILLYDGSQFMAITTRGYRTTATNGTNWETPVQDSQLKNRSNWTNASYFNGTYVIAGSDRYVSTSSDGTTWTAPTLKWSSGTGTWGLINHTSKFVALSSTGYTSTSADGTTWATVVQNKNISQKIWKCHTLGAGKFVAISSYGYIATSDNGLSWNLTDTLTLTHVPTSYDERGWQQIVYTGSMFIALHSNGYISTSTNGIIWSEPVIGPTKEYANWYAITYDKDTDTLIAFCYDSGSDKTYAAHSSELSSNPMTWTTSEQPVMECMVTTAYCSDSTFLIINNKGNTCTSTDGENWESHTNTGLPFNSPISISYFNGKFIALESDKYFYTSRDGATWEQSTEYEKAPIDETWVSITTDGSSVLSIMSKDGSSSLSSKSIVWTERSKKVDLFDAISLVSSKNNTLIAINSDNEISYSEDEKTWTTPEVNESFAVSNWVSIIKNDDFFIILNKHGEICASEGNQVNNWTTKTILNDYNWQSMCYNGSIYAAIGSTGVVAISTDLENWETYQINSNISNWTSIGCSDSNLVALSSNGDVAVSTNEGESWAVTEKAISQETDWKSVTYGNGYFVALSYYGYLSTSREGDIWTRPIANSSLGPNKWLNISYANNQFIVNSNNHYAISSNGMNWGDPIALKTKPSDYDYITLSFISMTKNSNNRYVALDSKGYLTVEYDSDLYYPGFLRWVKIKNLDGNIVGVSTDGRIITSEDGKEWKILHEIIPTPEGVYWNSITKGEGTYIAISRSGYISTSTNLKDWTQAIAVENLQLPLNDGMWQDIAYGAGKFVAIGGLAGYSITTIIATSEDGINWTEAHSDTNLGDHSYANLCFGYDKFVALGTDGAVSSSFDGTTWSIAEVSSSLEVLPTLPDMRWETLCYHNQHFATLSANGYYSRSTFTNYCHLSIGDIINDNLFELEENVKHYIRVLHEGGSYKVLHSTNGMDYTEIVNKESSEEMATPDILYIGNGPSLLTPFDGTLSLLDWKVISGDDVWYPAKEVTLQETQLLQDFHFPSLNYNSYRLSDLNNPNYTMDFLDNRFYSGYKEDSLIDPYKSDLIDFSYTNGVSLCLKVDLKDLSSKLIFAKTNLVGDIYCYVAFINKTLSFVIGTKSGYTNLSKKIGLNETSKYINTPFLLSIVGNRDFIKMYRNNEEIVASYGSHFPYPKAPTYTFANYIPADEINENHDILRNMCSTVSGISEYEALEKLTKEVVDNTSCYLKDMIVIKGTVSPEDLYYITNLTDTNYKSRD